MSVSVVSVRLVRDAEHPYRSRNACDSAAAFELFRDFLADLDREAFWVACLDSKNAPTCVSQVSMGSVKGTEVHPREVFKVAILSNANSIIVAHNHPSGDPRPSLDDILVTSRLQRAGELLGIRLNDHLILANDTYYSFADEDRM